MRISFEKAEQIAREATEKLNRKPVMLGDCYWTTLNDNELEIDVSYEYDDGDLMHVVELVDYESNETIAIQTGEGIDEDDLANTIFNLVNNNSSRF